MIAPKLIFRRENTMVVLVKPNWGAKFSKFPLSHHHCHPQAEVRTPTNKLGDYWYNYLSNQADVFQPVTFISTDWISACRTPFYFHFQNPIKGHCDFKVRITSCKGIRNGIVKVMYAGGCSVWPVVFFRETCQFCRAAWAKPGLTCLL